MSFFLGEQEVGQRLLFVFAGGPLKGILHVLAEVIFNKFCSVDGGFFCFQNVFGEFCNTGVHVFWKFFIVFQPSVECFVHGGCSIYISKGGGVDRGARGFVFVGGAMVDFKRCFQWVHRGGFWGCGLRILNGVY